MDLRAQSGQCANALCPTKCKVTHNYHPRSVWDPRRPGVKNGLRLYIHPGEKTKKNTSPCYVYLSLTTMRTRQHLIQRSNGGTCGHIYHAEENMSASPLLTRWHYTPNIYLTVTAKLIFFLGKNNAAGTHISVLEERVFLALVALLWSDSCQLGKARPSVSACKCVCACVSKRSCQWN